MKASGVRRFRKQSGGLFSRRTRKHGGQKRPSPRFPGPVAKPWLDRRKIHIGIDAQTREIWAVEVTSSDVGDAPILLELLGQIPPDQEIASVTADGAYDTRECHRFGGLRGPIRGHRPPRTIANRGAAAVISPRKNAKPWNAVTAGAVARNEALRASGPCAVATMERIPPPKPRRN